MRSQRPALGATSQRNQGSGPVASQVSAFAETFDIADRSAPRRAKAAYLIVTAAEAVAALLYNGDTTPA